MASTLELMQEAARRGILPAAKVPLYEEAVRRGLIEDARDRGFWGEAADAFERGARGAAQAVVADAATAGIVPPDVAASYIAETQQEVDRLPVPPSVQRFFGTRSWGDAVLEFARSPLEITSTLVAQSLGSSLPSIAGGAVGAGIGSLASPVGTVAGGAVGLGAGSAATETGAKILESFAEHGVDLTDPAQVAAAFADGGLIEQVRGDAIKRGVTIGAFDAVSGALAGRLVAGARTAGQVARRGAGEVAIQAGLGMGGEAAGSAVIGDPISPPDVLAEGLGEIGPGAVEVAAGTAVRGLGAAGQARREDEPEMQRPPIGARTEDPYFTEDVVPPPAPMPEPEPVAAAAPEPLGLPRPTTMYGDGFTAAPLADGGAAPAPDSVQAPAPAAKPTPLPRDMPADPIQRAAHVVGQIPAGQPIRRDVLQRASGLRGNLQIRALMRALEGAGYAAQRDGRLVSTGRASAAAGGTGGMGRPGPTTEGQPAPAPEPLVTQPERPLPEFVQQPDVTDAAKPDAVPVRPEPGTRVRVLGQDGSEFGVATVAGYTEGQRPRVRFVEGGVGPVKQPFADLVRMEPVEEMPAAEPAGEVSRGTPAADAALRPFALRASADRQGIPPPQNYRGAQRGPEFAGRAPVEMPQPEGQPVAEQAAAAPAAPVSADQALPTAASIPGTEAEVAPDSTTSRIAQPQPDQQVAPAPVQASAPEQPANVGGGFQGVPQKARPRPRRNPVPLLQFIRDQGGIDPDDPAVGDIRANLDKATFRLLGRPASAQTGKGGRGLDYIREAAVEAGYLPEDADINDLLDAIQKDAFAQSEGQPRVVSVEDVGQQIEMERRERERREEDRALQRFPSLDVAEAYVDSVRDLEDAVAEADRRLDEIEADIARQTREVLNGEWSPEERPDDADVPFEWIADREGGEVEGAGGEAAVAGEAGAKPGGEPEADRVGRDAGHGREEAGRSGEPGAVGASGQAPWRVEPHDGDAQSRYRVVRNDGNNRRDVWGYYATREQAESAREHAAKRAPASEGVATEQTDQGEQILVPGVAPVTDRARAEAKGSRKLRSDKAQKLADDGLFDVAGRGQGDLLSASAAKPGGGDDADAALLAGFPAGSAFIEGRGPLGRGRWAVAGPDGRAIWNYEATKEEAAKVSRERLLNVAENARETAERAEREGAIADRLRAGGEPTDADLKYLGLKSTSRFDYLSPVVQRLFGVSRAKVRAAMGDALRKTSTDMGAEIWQGNARKALMNAAAYGRPVADAKPIPLYVSRPVTNAEDILAWARSQGFKDTLAADDLHVTIAYSREPVAPNAAGKPPEIRQAVGRARSVERLGDEGAVVLRFESTALQARWQQYRDAGASWDYENYKPHVTITYNPGDVDLSKVEPYRGPIELGAERAEPLDDDATPAVKAEAEEVRGGDQARPAEGAAMSLSEFAEVRKAIGDGAITPAALRAAFARFRNSAEQIKSDIDAKYKGTKGMMVLRALAPSGRRKSEMVDGAYDRFAMAFYPGDGVSYSPMRETLLQAIERKLGETSDEDLAAYIKAQSERVVAARDKRAAIDRGMDDPQTLDDFWNLIERRGQKAFDALPDEKKALFDDLTAARQREVAATAQQKKAEVKGADLGDVGMSLVETKHTRDGYDLFVVKLSERIDGDAYKDLVGKAKRLGGWYSSYTKGGAIPGFQFKTRDAAEQFMQIGRGEAVSTAGRIEERREEAKATAASKLRDMADRMTAAADAKLGADRLVNTVRRAGIAASAEQDALYTKRIAATLRNIADALEDGSAKNLEGIRDRVQVELLDRMLRHAVYEADRKLSYGEQEKRKGRPVTDSDIQAVTFPEPSAHVENVIDVARAAQDIPGAKRAAANVLKRAMAAKGAEQYRVEFRQPFGPGQQEDMGTVIDALKKRSKDAPYALSMVEDGFKDAERLKRMGIADSASLRAALREYNRLRDTGGKVDPIRVMERALIGRKIEGYFPTPKALVERMIEEADIAAGDRVLEPSAGKGNIADAIRDDAGVQPDTIEVNSDLRGILEAKGHALVDRDFLQFDGRYDKILMNPPFENGLDIDHVRHAHGLLNPGGRVVAIMSEGPFYRSDKKATEFRAWLESVGGRSEKNPEGSFLSSERSTGVATRLVVIDAADARISYQAAGPTTEQRTVAAAVRDLLARIAPGAPVDLPDAITMRDGRAAYGRVLDGIISIALNAPRKLNTARHEAIHWLRESGHLSEGQWAVLTRAVYRNGWLERFDVAKRYAGLTPEQQVEEAIAEAYAAWADGTLQAKGGVEKVLGYMRRFFDRVREAIRSALGREPDWRDVFAAVEGGKAGRSAAPAPRKTGSAFADMLLRGVARFLPAWHGSPHDFERFSLEKIGTGEGAQAFGWGLYFSSRKAIAEHYRKGLSGAGVRIGGVDHSEGWRKELRRIFTTDTTGPDAQIEEIRLKTVIDAISEAIQDGISPLEAFDRAAEYHLTTMLARGMPAAHIEHDRRARAAQRQRIADLNIETFERGRLYEVELTPEPEHLLDWDKPLSEQSEYVRERLDQLEVGERDFNFVGDRAPTGRDAYEALSERLAIEAGLAADVDIPGSPRGWGAVGPVMNDKLTDDRAASIALLEAGIPGLRYLDAGSRSKGEGAHNYVVFDENAVEVRAKFQVAESYENIHNRDITADAAEAREQSAGFLRRVVGRLDKFLNPIEGLPEIRTYLAERYRTYGTIARVQDVAGHLTKPFAKASKADAEAVYEYLTTAEASPRAIADAGVRKAAVDAKRAIDRIGRQLVAKGLLSKEAYDRHKDAYLPRVYLRHLLEQQGVSGAATVTAGGKKVSDLGYLKQRKDIPEDVRRYILGQILDPQYLATRALVKPARDIALLDFLDYVSRDKRWIIPWSVVSWNGQRVTVAWLKAEAARLRRMTDHQPAEDAAVTREIAANMETAADAALREMGMARVDMSDYRQVPDAPRYGRMRGLWVRQEIHEDLVGSTQWVTGDGGNFAQRLLGQGGTLTKATQLWKLGKVALNPPTQVRNAISNAIMLHLSGVNAMMVIPRLIEAVGQMRSRGEYWQVAQRYGITEATFAHNELFRLEAELKEALDRSGSPLARVATLFGKIGNAAGDLYQATESAFKIAKIIDEMKKGRSAETAALEAQKWLFDYSLVSGTTQYLRNAPLGVPFMCVDDTTEMLTAAGWKSIDEVAEGDLAASFDMKTERLVWKPVEGVYRAPYSGDMIHVKDRHLDMLLTPDHRCVTYRRRRVPGERATNGVHLSLEIQTAENLTVADHIPVAAPFDHQPDGDERIGVDLAALLGWIVTEGSLHNKCAAVHLYQREGHKADRIRALLRSVATSGWRENAVQHKGRRKDGAPCNMVHFYINASFGRRIRDLIPGKQLTPALLARMTIEEIGAMVDAMIDGDGSRHKTSGREVFIQNDGPTLEAFQMALVMLGRSFGVSRHGDGKVVTIRTGTRYCVKRATRDRAHYDGRIWCPKVRDTATWVARRNGKVFITHNTYYTKVMPRLIEVAATAPWRLAPYFTIPMAMAAWVAAEWDVDDDDLDKLRAALPEWLRNRGTGVVPLPYKDGNGNWQFVDLSFFFPWAMFEGLGRAAASGDVTQFLSQAGILGGPVPQVISAFQTGIDPFSGKPIVDEYDRPAKKLASLLNFAWSLAMPPWMTEYGFANRLWEATQGVVDPRTGKPRYTEEQALLRAVGVNVYPIDPVASRASNLRRMDFEIREVKARMKRELRNPNLSDDQRREIAADYREMLAARAAQMRQYAVDSEVNPKLLRAAP